MNASELKYQVEQHGNAPYFFTSKEMRFFGDTMKNYGVRETTVETYDAEKVDVYELYRRHPVKHGLQSSAYFDKSTFGRVYPKH